MGIEFWAGGRVRRCRGVISGRGAAFGPGRMRGRRLKNAADGRFFSVSGLSEHGSPPARGSEFLIPRSAPAMVSVGVVHPECDPGDSSRLGPSFTRRSCSPMRRFWSRAASLPKSILWYSGAP